MTHIMNAAELIGLVYLALCLLVIGLFVGSVAITDLAWRRRQRKRRSTINITGYIGGRRLW